MATHDYDRDIKMASSPGSSDLSELASEDEEEHTSFGDRSSRPSVDRALDDQAHPSKRRKTNLHHSYERALSSQPEPDLDDILSVSEDSFGSAPGSPTHDEYVIRDEAQLECLWKDCDFGRATNNDELVQHVQVAHCATGGPKRSKYICEWGECQNKKSNVHPSNYALKAHCRSHTKEKPYYCALPECDKAFTRSDALAKHMRTVHEPEPVKGSNTGIFLDPPAISGKSAQSKPVSIIRPAPTQAFDDNGREIDPSRPEDNITYIPAHHPITGQPGFMIHYPPDVHFSTWESGIRADDLMRFLRRQIKWAQDEGKVIEAENARLEKLRREEWMLKELLLEGLVKAEQSRAGKLRTLKIAQPRFKDAMDSAEIDSIRKRRPAQARRSRAKETVKEEPAEETSLEVPPAEADEADYEIEPEPETSPAPAEGGFEGEDDPYDNYLKDMMEKYGKGRESI